MNIVTETSDVCKYLFNLCETVEKLSSKQFKHLNEFVQSVICNDGKRTVSNMTRNIYDSVDRSNMCRFLSESPWDSDTINQNRINQLNHLIELEQQKSKEPIFEIFDDTMISKSNHSKHIEGMGKLFSHVTGKYEWSHCLLGHHAIVGKLSVPMNMTHYLREEYCLENSLPFKSKIDSVIEQLKLLKVTEGVQRYLLLDKWFSSVKLLYAALKEGLHVLVPLKSNRIIYPHGISTKIRDYANSLDKLSLDSVTVKEQLFHVHRYEGNLKNFENAVVLISYEYKNGEFREPMFILSTDISLGNREIIEYYLKRWTIEVSFQYQKDKLGLDHYQIRSLNAIKRFWLIVQLALTYLSIQNYHSHNTIIGDMIRIEKIKATESEIYKIISLYEMGIPISDICNKFTKKAA